MFYIAIQLFWPFDNKSSFFILSHLVKKINWLDKNKLLEKSIGSNFEMNLKPP